VGVELRARKGIIAPLVRLTSSEELLQPALVLVVTDAPQDIHVQLVLVALRQEYVPLEHFPLLEQQRVAHPVLLVIHARLDRLTSSEELLQPALVLVLSDVPQDTHVQPLLVALCQGYALLEHFLLQVQQHVQPVLLDTHAPLVRLTSSEELLQPALDLVVDYVLQEHMQMPQQEHV
jgi:hypothetical protein